MHEDLIAAIRARNLIHFDYHGHYRVVEPHVFGRQEGVDRLFGFQVRGTSSSRLIPNWQTFDLAEMRHMSALPETFPRARPTPFMKPSDWEEVYAAAE